MEYPQGFADSHWRKRGICGVLAVAIAAEVTFEVAHAACKRAMLELKLGVRFRGGTWHRQRVHALRQLGVKFVEYPEYKGMTFRQFIDEYAVEDVTYMLANKGHVISVRNGMVADQANIKPRQEHKYGGRSVIDKPVIAILGKGW